MVPDGYCLAERRQGQVGKWGSGELGNWGGGELGDWGTGELGKLDGHFVARPGSWRVCPLRVGLGLETQAELRSDGPSNARADLDPERSSGWFSSPSVRYTQTTKRCGNAAPGMCSPPLPQSLLLIRRGPCARSAWDQAFACLASPPCLGASCGPSWGHHPLFHVEHSKGVSSEPKRSVSDFPIDYHNKCLFYNSLRLLSKIHNWLPSAATSGSM